jgi:calcium-dependent protein kinase
MYIMLCGYPPFQGETDVEILENVQRGEYEFKSPDWDEVSE